METLSIVTPPAVLPVTLDAMKLHLRVELDATEEDELITALTAAATDLVEARCKRAFVNRTLAWAIDGFPNLCRMGRTPGAAAIHPLALTPPDPPLVSVEEILYLDKRNDAIAVDPDAYRAIPGTPGRIVLAGGASWPLTLDGSGDVTITYIAGYGPDETTVPPAIVAAIKLLVGGWYRNRESVTPGAMAELPLGVKALLNSAGWGFYG